jgi:2,3-dihydroxybenzoate decarboxylase
MKKIAVEEHFFTRTHLDHLRSRESYPRLEITEDAQQGKVERLFRTPTSSQAFGTEKVNRLLDIGAGRVAEMDAAGIDMQVLSLSGPGVEELDMADSIRLARNANDQLAEAIKAHPGRFAGFAALPYGNPLAAAEELERAVTRLGLCGAKINSHIGGQYLDDKKFWPLFETAEKLDVPVYIHPKEPPPGLLKLLSPYPGLATAMWGFAAEAGLHAMRLICSGLFDAHPKLKIVLGHLGEAIPFWLWRIDNSWQKGPPGFPRRKPSEYFMENFFVTTSGMFEERVFMYVYDTLGADRIMFAVDYPYESNEKGSAFIDAVPISEVDKAKICHLNAQKLMKLH